MIYKNKFITSKLKPYKIQDVIFSCLRSKIAYEKQHKIVDIFKKDGNRDIFNCKLMCCDIDIRTKINDIVNNITTDMVIEPIIYTGLDNPIRTNDIQAYLLYKSNTIYITFRGTISPSNLIDALDARKYEFKKGLIIHNGFMNQFTSIEQNLTRDIRNIKKEFNIERIIFSGHSSGGSLATIASFYYGNLFPDVFISNMTFGMPIMANINFVNEFCKVVDESIRIELENDIIPNINFNKNFIHIPNGIRLYKNGIVKSDYINDNILFRDVILKAIADKNLDDIYNSHSCEQYITRLIDIEYIKKN